MAQGNVAGGAVVGAVIGGLSGAVVGWLLGAQVTDIPVIGPLTGSGVLASVLGGIVAGGGIGALIGALVGSISPSDEEPTEGLLKAAPEVVEDVPAAEEQPPTALDTRQVDTAVARDEGEGDGANRAYRESTEAAAMPAEVTEASTMNESDELEPGRNPESFTGTEDSVDPGTGAVGTGGTPLTTGYGVSGSTIGTGSESGEAAQREGEDFRGATPDTKAYEFGGRGSGDRGVLKGDERTLPAETRYSDAGLEEAPAQREPAARDIYEEMPGYGENVTRGGLADSAPEGTGTTGVDRDAPQESAGTNLPGTADPRGLGDNTDET